MLLAEAFHVTVGVLFVLGVLGLIVVAVALVVRTLGFVFRQWPGLAAAIGNWGPRAAAGWFAQSHVAGTPTRMMRATVRVAAGRSSMNTIWTPMDERSRQRQFEDSFHRQLRARATKLIHGSLPADRVVVESMPDGRDAVRATLNRLEMYDLDLLNELPGTRAVSLEFGRQLIWPLSYTVARVRAQVLTPTAALVAGETPGPIGRDQVQYALDRYELLPTSQRPTAVILASATGFTPEARAMVTDSDLPKLVLVGGREDGGWDVEMSDSVRYSPWAQLVEFETQDDHVRRLLYHLDKEAAALESRGIALSELSDKLGLPLEQTEAAVRQACRSDPRLMTVVHEGELHVARSPLADEVGAMSLWMRIRRLFGFKPSTAERVRIMTAQRVQLEQQREELDRRLDALEAEERGVASEGAAAATEAEEAARRQAGARAARLTTHPGPGERLHPADRHYRHARPQPDAGRAGPPAGAAEGGRPDARGGRSRADRGRVGGQCGLGGGHRSRRADAAAGGRGRRHSGRVRPGSRGPGGGQDGARRGRCGGTGARSAGADQGG